MKLLQVFLAFASIYLFSSVVAGILLFCAWLNTFHADTSEKPFARISYSSKYEEYKNSTALNAMLRVRVDKEDIMFSETFVGTALFFQYDHGILSEQLVPIGFTSMYRLQKVTNENGDVLYQRKEAFTDRVFRGIFRNHITWSTVVISTVATNETKTYTVSALSEKLLLDED